MLALFSAAFILFGAPAILFYAGRLIVSVTDTKHSGATTSQSVLTGNEWFCRSPQPIFGQGAALRTQVSEPAPIVETAGQSGDTWFFRPMPPLVVWPDLRRLFRSGRRTAG